MNGEVAACANTAQGAANKTPASTRLRERVVEWLEFFTTHLPLLLRVLRYRARIEARARERGERE
jgi:hypothetical protein